MDADSGDAQKLKLNESKLDISLKLTGAPNSDDKPVLISIQIAKAIGEVLTKIVSWITWPVVVITTILLFNVPISRMLELLPAKFEQSDEISFGTILSLKIQEQAKAPGNEELVSMVGGLSQEAIGMILTMHQARLKAIYYDDTPDVTPSYSLAPYYSTWVELSDKGLATGTSMELHEFQAFFDSLGPQDGKVAADSLTAEQKAILESNKVQLTEAGESAYKKLLALIADSLAKE